MLVVPHTLYKHSEKKTNLRFNLQYFFPEQKIFAESAFFSKNQKNISPQKMDKSFFPVVHNKKQEDKIFFA